MIGLVENIPSVLTRPLHTLDNNSVHSVEHSTETEESQCYYEQQMFQRNLLLSTKSNVLTGHKVYSV